MKFSSPVYSAVSGAVGGLVYARARGGGMYARARALPTNPNTDRQQNVRQYFGAAVQAFKALSQPQRDAWDLYAKNCPITDALGATSLCSGQNMWMRYASLNQLLNFAATPTLIGGPTTFDTGTPPSIADISYDIAGGLTGTNPAVASGDTMIFFGRPQNASVSFYKGPYRFGTAVAGNLVVATAVITSETDYVYATGQKIPLCIRNVRDDGRVSQQVTVMLPVP